MKRSRFSEEQIIGVLKEHEAVAKAGDLARKQGISEATLYNWKSKYGGMEGSEAKRLKALEEENAKLKKLLAEQMLKAAALRELLSKKSGRARRQARGGRHRTPTRSRIRPMLFMRGDIMMRMILERQPKELVLYSPQHSARLEKPAHGPRRRVTI